MSFCIGSYFDKILLQCCQIDATHLLLGRPWKFDHRTHHDCFLDTYMFNVNGKHIILLPLCPNEVLQDYGKRNKSKAIEDVKKCLKPTVMTVRVDPPTRSSWPIHPTKDCLILPMPEPAGRFDQSFQPSSPIAMGNLAHSWIQGRCEPRVLLSRSSGLTSVFEEKLPCFLFISLCPNTSSKEHITLLIVVSTLLWEFKDVM